MNNPFYIPPVNTLQALIAGGQAYQQGQDRQRDERNELAKLLMLKEDRAFRQQQATQAQSNADRTYDLQRQAQSREPENIRALRAAGIDPTSPEGRKVAFPRTDSPISAFDKKATLDAENELPNIAATIRNVERAMELNPQVFTGSSGGVRKWIGKNLPEGVTSSVIAPKAGTEATAEWDQLMGQEAVKNMSETLKGASTDFEMKKFISIAADTTQSADVRQRAMQRFITLAKDELELRKKRVSGMRDGTYFKPGGGQSAQPPALVPGQTQMNGYIYKGGNPNDPASWAK